MTTNNTATIVKEFNALVDEDTVYTLVEMKKILTDVYKATSNASKKNKKTKKNTDGEKKTKNASPYNLFFKEMYPIIKKDHPNMDNKEVMKHVALLWKKKKDDDSKTNSEDENEIKKEKKEEPNMSTDEEKNKDIEIISDDDKNEKKNKGDNKKKSKKTKKDE